MCWKHRPVGGHFGSNCHSTPSGNRGLRHPSAFLAKGRKKYNTHQTHKHTRTDTTTHTQPVALWEPLAATEWKKVHHLLRLCSCGHQGDRGGIESWFRTLGVQWSRASNDPGCLSVWLAGCLACWLSGCLAGKWSCMAKGKNGWMFLTRIYTLRHLCLSNKHYSMSSLNNNIQIGMTIRGVNSSVVFHYCWSLYWSFTGFIIPQHLFEFYTLRVHKTCLFRFIWCMIINIQQSEGRVWSAEGKKANPITTII